LFFLEFMTVSAVLSSTVRRARRWGALSSRALRAAGKAGLQTAKIGALIGRAGRAREDAASVGLGEDATSPDDEGLDTEGPPEKRHFWGTDGSFGPPGPRTATQTDFLLLDDFRQTTIRTTDSSGPHGFWDDGVLRRYLRERGRRPFYAGPFANRWLGESLLRRASAWKSLLLVLQFFSLALCCALLFVVLFSPASAPWIEPLARHAPGLGRGVNFVRAKTPPGAFARSGFVFCLLFSLFAAWGALRSPLDIFWAVRRQIWIRQMTTKLSALRNSGRRRALFLQASSAAPSWSSDLLTEFNREHRRRSDVDFSWSFLSPARFSSDDDEALCWICHDEALSAFLPARELLLPRAKRDARERASRVMAQIAGAAQRFLTSVASAWLFPLAIYSGAAFFAQRLPSLGEWRRFRRAQKARALNARRWRLLFARADAAGPGESLGPQSAAHPVATGRSIRQTPIANEWLSQARALCADQAAFCATQRHEAEALARLSARAKKWACEADALEGLHWRHGLLPAGALCLLSLAGCGCLVWISAWLSMLSPFSAWWLVVVWGSATMVMSIGCGFLGVFLCIASVLVSLDHAGWKRLVRSGLSTAADAVVERLAIPPGAPLRTPERLARWEHFELATEAFGAQTHSGLPIPAGPGQAAQLTPHAMAASGIAASSPATPEASAPRRARRL